MGRDNNRSASRAQRASVDDSHVTRTRRATTVQFSARLRADLAALVPLFKLSGHRPYASLTWETTGLARFLPFADARTPRVLVEAWPIGRGLAVGVDGEPYCFDSALTAAEIRSIAPDSAEEAEVLEQGGYAGLIELAPFVWEHAGQHLSDVEPGAWNKKLWGWSGGQIAHGNSDGDTALTAIVAQALAWCRGCGTAAGSPGPDAPARTVMGFD
jgi:hypothetical protein